MLFHKWVLYKVLEIFNMKVGHICNVRQEAITARRVWEEVIVTSWRSMKGFLEEVETRLKSRCNAGMTNGSVMLGQVRSMRYTSQGSWGHSKKFNLPELKLCRRSEQQMETPSDWCLLSVGDVAHNPGSELRSFTGLFTSHSPSVVWHSKYFRLL